VALEFQAAFDQAQIYLNDVAGYNGDGTGYNNPGVPNMVSEYGADVSSTRPGAYDAGWGNLTVSNGMAAQPAWRSGISRWCMFDYGSQMSAQYINSGIIDNFRIPKRSYYWYRNTYAKVPPPTWPVSGTAAGLKLTASTTTLSTVDGTLDAWLLVTVVDASGTASSNMDDFFGLQQQPVGCQARPSARETCSDSLPALRSSRYARPNGHGGARREQ
jgi:beta-galactosidase